MGMVQLLEEGHVIDENMNVDYLLLAAPDELTAKVISGEVQIATVPANMAAILYNKTEQGIQAASINTLGNLFVLTNGADIQKIEDLAGQKIYISGQGATPEYATRYLLDKAGIADDVEIEFISEHSELATLLMAGEAQIAVLPEPFVSTVTLKSEEVTVALNLKEVWEELSPDSMLAMTCLIVNKEFAKANPEAVEKFLKAYEGSINYVNTNQDEAAQKMAELEIIGSAEIAKSAIPNCAIVYLDAHENKDALDKYFDVLFEFNPAAVGGSLPDEAFYYQK
jgi:NitT/TauT family transport system substrate-binding protein